MRSILAFILALLPGSVLAGGAPASVQVPCLPETQYHLCDISDVDIHAPGYLPRTVPTQAVVYPNADRFEILVTPNIAPYEFAVRDAARAALAYCGASPGERIAATISGRDRYAEGNLESWKFSGSCR